MITFRPLDALSEEIGGSPCSRYYAAEEWLLIFAWFAQRYYNPRAENRWEVFNRTSNINNSDLNGFDPSEAGSEARGRLADIFKHAGLDTSAGLFLWRIGIREHADLSVPISIPGRVPQWSLPWWGNQKARWFTKPGPNRFHPEARWVVRARLTYSPWRARWALGFVYSYEHEDSTWCEGVVQERRESLDRFAARVDQFIRERFEPEDRNGPLYRPERERAWQRAEKAMRALFPWGVNVPPNYSEQIADILADKGGRFDLTPRRLATLKRWAREAVADALKGGQC